MATRWLWASRSVAARLTRAALVPPALLYRSLMALRTRAYDVGLLPRAIPSVPTVAVGNLTVGGSGKTPIAAWIASYYARKHRTPGVVLRGYGGDEGAVHRRLVPEAVVVEHPDRLRGAAEAVAAGADVIVLDDAFQRLDVGRDLNIAVVSAESSRAARWSLPAGPWREGWSALRRADLVVVTRKRAGRTAARTVLRRVRRVAPRAETAVAHLGVSGFRGLLSGAAVSVDRLVEARVLVSAGIADPGSLARQCAEFGARVRVLPWPDHHRFPAPDVARLLESGRRVDYVVVTEKDAAKLRRRWPHDVREPLVAVLGVTWEHGRSVIERALDAVTADVTDLLAEPTTT